MRTTLCTAAVLLTLLGGVHAGADDAAPQATDVCGDGGTAVTGGQGRAEAEAAAPGQDLRSAALRVVRPADGPAVLLGTLGTCGAASDGADYTLTWQYRDGCLLSLRRARTVVGARPATGLSESCPDDGVVAVRDAVDLPDTAFAVVDDAAVFRVPLELVPAALLPRLAPGTAWDATTASASAPPASVGDVRQGSRVGDRDTSTDVSVRRDELRGGGGVVEQPEG